MRLLFAGADWLPCRLVLMLSPARGLTPDAERSASPDFIVTAAPVYKPLAELRGQERFPEGAQLLLVHAGKTEPLVTGFAASADANVSFDGQTVLFAGKQSAGDPWQIWELTLKDRSVRKVIGHGNGRGAALLSCPAGGWCGRSARQRDFNCNRATMDIRLRKVPESDGGAGGVAAHAYVERTHFPPTCCTMDGFCLKPGFRWAKDRRRRCIWSTPTARAWSRCAAIMGGRAGAERNWHRETWSSRTGRHWRASPRRWRMRSRFERRAANTQARLPRPLSGAWLLSARATTEPKFAIKMWKPGAAAMHTVLARNGEDLVEPVLIAPRKRPNRHPSGLHPWDYANLLALDARVSARRGY